MPLNRKSVRGEDQVAPGEFRVQSSLPSRPPSEKTAALVALLGSPCRHHRLKGPRARVVFGCRSPIFSSTTEPSYLSPEGPLSARSL